jgi:CBS domain-containing protein
MSVRDLMTTDVPIARLEDTVRDAARLMDATHVKHLLVCNDDRFEGIVHVDVEWSQLGRGVPHATFVAAL